MKTRLACPCGTVIRSEDEADLVEKAQRHLAERHPDRHYSEEDILAISL